MSEAPWFRFFPSDWLNGTHGLSLVQKGLYITMVAMMYDRGEPLKIKREALARRCSVTLRQVSDALDILIEEGKILDTPEGYWNERVARELHVRDEKIQKAKGAAAAREEKKNQLKQQWELSNDDPEIIARSSILDSRYKNLEKEDSCPKPASPPSGLFGSDEAHDEPAQKPKKRHAYLEDFEQFWSLYPPTGRLDKKECGDFWKKMDPEDRAKAIAAIPAFKAWIAKQGPDYRVLYAIRYLRKERFNDIAVGPAGTAEIKIDWVKRLGFARKLKQWDLRNWGPMPGQPGCAAPSDVLTPEDGSGWTEFKPGGGST